MTTKPNPAPSLPVHHLAARVYYDDTDAGGVVYHANYLRFAERGRCEFLRSLGYDNNWMHKEFGLLLVARHVEIDYRASAVLDDLLDISTEIAEIGNSSMKVKHVVSCKDKVLAEIIITLVAVSGIGKASRIPPQLRQIFGR
ncbi:MAG: YbgC/FadM family acyl-CoA thioesterase [Alphaproteobacteria bacterium]